MVKKLAILLALILPFASYAGYVDDKILYLDSLKLQQALQGAMNDLGRACMFKTDIATQFANDYASHKLSIPFSVADLIDVCLNAVDYSKGYNPDCLNICATFAYGYPGYLEEDMTNLDSIKNRCIDQIVNQIGNEDELLSIETHNSASGFWTLRFDHGVVVRGSATFTENRPEGSTVWSGVDPALDSYCWCRIDSYTTNDGQCSFSSHLQWIGVGVDRTRNIILGAPDCTGYCTTYTLENPEFVKAMLDKVQY